MEQMKIEIPIEDRIINSFAALLPHLSEIDKIKLLAYSEGMGFVVKANSDKNRNKETIRK